MEKKGWGRHFTVVTYLTNLFASWFKVIYDNSFQTLYVVFLYLHFLEIIWLSKDVRHKITWVIVFAAKGYSCFEVTCEPYYHETNRLVVVHRNVFVCPFHMFHYFCFLSWYKPAQVYKWCLFWHAFDIELHSEGTSLEDIGNNLTWICC